MAYLKAAVAMTLDVYISRLFVDCSFFQMGYFIVAIFLLTSVSRSPFAIAELLVNFWGPIHISGMAEARALKFCTRETISSLAKGMTNHP